MEKWFIAYHKWITTPFVVRNTLGGERLINSMGTDEWKVFSMNCRYIDLPFPHFFSINNMESVRYFESYEVAMEGK